MTELRALLEAVRVGRKDDTARLVLADWLDESHPNPVIRRDELPAGFNAYWHANALSYQFGVREYPRTGRGKWSSVDIVAALKEAGKKAALNWTALVGASEIEGFPVLVFEPACSQEQALALCQIIQRAVGLCPVSFNRCGTAKRPRMRLAIWYTVQPTEEQRSEEVAQIMSRIFRPDGNDD